MAVAMTIDGSSVEQILADTLGGVADDYEAIAHQVHEVAHQLLNDGLGEAEASDNSNSDEESADPEGTGSGSGYFISLLERIRWGQDATALLQADIEDRVTGFMFRLPLFLPRTNIRVQWSEPLIGYVDPGEARELRWRAWDRKTGELEGVVEVRGVMNAQIDMGEGWTARVTETLHTRRRPGLKKLVADGEKALWDLIMMWRPKLYTQVQIASSGVLHEIFDTGEGEDSLVGGVIDVVEAEQIVDELLYGKEGEDSIFIRIAHRVAGDLRDGSGDPWAWVQRNLRSASESAVRRLIGDPAAGRKIRRVHRALGEDSTLDSLLEAYREEFPNEKMGKKRIVDALSAGSTAHRSSLQMSLLMAMA